MGKGWRNSDITIKPNKDNLVIYYNMMSPTNLGIYELYKPTWRYSQVWPTKDWDSRSKHAVRWCQQQPTIRTSQKYGFRWFYHQYLNGLNGELRDQIWWCCKPTNHRDIIKRIEGFYHKNGTVYVVYLHIYNYICIIYTYIYTYTLYIM
jgi:hypothetical protein